MTQPAAHPIGWHVPIGWQIALVILVGPLAIAGALLTLSLWYSTLGLPLLVLSVPAVVRVLRPARVRSGHPAFLLEVLVLADFALGVGALTIDADFWRGLGLLLMLHGIALAVTTRGIRRSAVPIVPPPPVATTRHRASGWQR